MVESNIRICLTLCVVTPDAFLISSHMKHICQQENKKRFKLNMDCVYVTKRINSS